MIAPVDTNLVTVAEAAALLRVDRSTIRRWIREGSLPALRVGHRQVRIRRGDLSAAVSPISETPTHDSTGRKDNHLIPRLTADDQRKMLEAADRAERLHAEQRMRGGGDPAAPPSWVLINEARDERSRQI
jgi:excisionase family DNA binding protein